MTEILQRKPPGTDASFHVDIAQSAHEVHEAQRLRYSIFVEEYGAQLVRSRDRLEQDWLDPYCEHLLVRDKHTREVVGTCRILNPKQAERIGGWYLDTEFNLDKLRPLQSKLIEVGRVCVHPAYQQESVMSLLWSGLEMHMIYQGYEYQMSCGSISLTDGGANATEIHSQIMDTLLSLEHWRVFPWHPFPIHSHTPINHMTLPPLMREALRRGSLICGPPAWEPNFNTADFLLLLPLPHINLRLKTTDLEKVLHEHSIGCVNCCSNPF